MIFRSDHSAKMTQVYHKLNFALIGLGPLALVASPSALSFPLDLALGAIIPLHSHIAGNDFITDYGHKITKAPAFENGLRMGLLGVTSVMFAGLLKLNMQGPGITASLKSVWRGRRDEAN
jgi:succinate dehydrogenase (ubiquinone) membrane anchor subunit